MRNWRQRHWLTAIVGAVAVALAVGLPTDVIPNPLFGRPVDVTWWSYPSLAITHCSAVYCSPHMSLNHSPSRTDTEESRAAYSASSQSVARSATNSSSSHSVHLGHSTGSPPPNHPRRVIDGSVSRRAPPATQHCRLMRGTKQRNDDSK